MPFGEVDPISLVGVEKVVQDVKVLIGQSFEGVRRYVIQSRGLFVR